MFCLQDAFSYGFGVRVGVALVLLAWVLWDTFVDDSLGQDVWHDPAFKVPRFLYILSPIVRTASPLICRSTLHIDMIVHRSDSG